MPDMSWVLGALTLFLGVLAVFWKHIDKRFDQMEAQHRRDMSAIEVLRAEIYRDFLRRDDHNDFTADLRSDLTELYSRLNTCAEQLNQMIGQHLSELRRTK